MEVVLLLTLIAAVVITVAGLLGSIFSQQLSLVARILSALWLTMLALFCAFGFLASFEPGENSLVWRTGYGISFVVCVGAVGRLIFTLRQKSEA